MPGDRQNSEERILLSENVEADSPLPRFEMPEAVGLPMSREAISAIVQRSVEEMAAGLDCVRMAALSYLPSGARLSGVTTVGYRDETFRAWNLSAADIPPISRALRERALVVLPDESELPARLAEHLKGEILVTPLRLGERTLAVLVGQLQAGVAVHSKTWRARALEVSARAALVVELERVTAEYQEELRRRQYVRAIAAAILESRPLQDIAALIVDEVAERLREGRVGLFLRDSGDRILPIALRNISPEFGENVARVAQRTPLRDRSTATGLPIYTRDAQNAPAFSPEMRALLRRENVSSVLMAMLQHGESVRGGLVVYTGSERQFTPLELAAFQGLADMATLGIAVSQQMEQQREIAMAEERNRLAREIHDTVAQSLAALVLQMETTQTYLEADDRSAAHDMLVAAREQAQLALQETRRAVQGLAPLSLETMSPAKAIAQELVSLETQEGLTTQFILTGEEQPLTPDQRATLLRVAQEAINNARHHAQAQRVRVGLQYGIDDVTLLVEDDGIGFDIEARRAPGPEGGYGLFGMEERARLVGGALDIDSTPGWGTRVRTVLPYRPSSPLPGAARIQPEPPPPTTTPTLTSQPAAVTLPAAAMIPGRADSDRLRVLVADDHALARQGIRTMLELSGEVTVVGEAGDGAQAEALARQLRPDLVLMDLQMPEVDGLEGLRRIHAEQPDLPVIILTTFQTDEAVAEALRSGARGFLLKDAGSADLVAALHAAHRGETVLAPPVTERLALLATGQTARPANSDFNLNERELEVLQLLTRGARNKEIGAALFIAPKTVEYHLSNIFAKLGVSNRTEAARIALDHRLGVK